MSNSNGTECVLIRTHEGVLQIEIHRPDKKNALTTAMYTALRQALEQAEQDQAIRAVVLTGGADCFTSGNDLKDFMEHPPQDSSSPVFEFLTVLSRTEKPLIAAVSGPAVGIGTTLLLHCDLVYAGINTLFQLPFVNLGLCPEAGSSLLLPQRLGHQRAAELLLLGEPFGAEKAREFGLVNEILEDAEVLEAALARARRIAAQPPAAVRLTKALMKRADAQTLNEVIYLEGKHFIERLRSAEAQEALRAFLERRKPDFSHLDQK